MSNVSEAIFLIAVDTHYWVPPAQNRTDGIPASNVVHHI
jgi:hypothetical protein